MTEEEIRQAVRDTMDRLAPGGGFCWCGGYLGAIDDPEVIRKMQYCLMKCSVMEISFIKVMREEVIRL
ncbi:MAG: hypothetical protein ACLRMZ_09370 [Blautia marasmi]